MEVWKIHHQAVAGWLPHAVIGLVGAVVVACAIWHPLGAVDTFGRYAPMAEAFARGDWANAFHPRFGVGFQTATGCLAWLTGLDGYRCCSAVSALAWMLCLIPLFRLADNLFGRTAAWFALVLFLLCPQTLVWSFKGFRESSKMLGVLLATDALVQWREEKSCVPRLEAVCGLVLLFTVKVDMVAVGFLFVAAYAVADRFRGRSWLVNGIGLVALQGVCALVYAWSGWWLPAVQYIPLAKRLIGG